MRVRANEALGKVQGLCLLPSTIDAALQDKRISRHCEPHVSHDLSGDDIRLCRASATLELWSAPVRIQQIVNKGSRAKSCPLGRQCCGVAFVPCVAGLEEGRLNQLRSFSAEGQLVHSLVLDDLVHVLLQASDMAR